MVKVTFTLDDRTVSRLPGGGAREQAAEPGRPGSRQRLRRSRRAPQRGRAHPHAHCTGHDRQPEAYPSGRRRRPRTARDSCHPAQRGPAPSRLSAGVIHLDTSTLIDALTGARCSAPALRRAIDEGERVQMSTIVLYDRSGHCRLCARARRVPVGARPVRLRGHSRPQAARVIRSFARNPATEARTPKNGLVTTTPFIITYLRIRVTVHVRFLRVQTIRWAVISGRAGASRRRTCSARKHECTKQRRNVRPHCELSLVSHFDGTSMVTPKTIVLLSPSAM